MILPLAEFFQDYRGPAPEERAMETEACKIAILAYLIFLFIGIMVNQFQIKIKITWDYDMKNLDGTRTPNMAIIRIRSLIKGIDINDLVKNPKHYTKKKLS